MSRSKRRRQRQGRVAGITAYMRRVQRHEWCPYCHKKLLPKLSSIDHIHPQSFGGKRVWFNETRVCVKCNNKKGNMTLLDFLMSGGKHRPDRLKPRAVVRLDALSDLPKDWKNPLATLGYDLRPRRDSIYMGLGARERKVLRQKLAAGKDS